MPTCCVHPLPYHADPRERFALVRAAPGACLLDGGRPGADRGRFDLFSAWPEQRLSPESGEDGRAFLARCRAALASLGRAEAPDGCELPFTGGLLGYLGYDFGRRLERLPAQAADDLQLPDAAFGLHAWALVSDHQRQTSQLVFHPSLAAQRRDALIALFEAPATPAPPGEFRLLAPFAADIDAGQYQAAIERIQAYIRAGDCYQVNFAQRFQAPWQGDPWAAYGALRDACPTPFAGYLALDDGAILSLSPERFLSVRQGQVETRPIKGTRPRGRDAGEDRALAAELLASRKDRAENLMIVDLLRNDLGRSCRTGSVRVPELFALESYPNVHHLVSSVTGELAAGLDAFDLLAGSFPGGSITGAPKIRAMQIIDELEPSRRSIYCGSLLFIDSRGEMDSSICIRTVLLQAGQASCWGGGGIVMDSEWQSEYEESKTKVRVLLQTLEATLD
ncbi:para-aminobenzoate synthetase component 1 [Geopseudomonas sagittaria]|uniref:aminodeoxychorismate synthase n=1 Tax=Geopseudomonas sagittaria TaxID=1135990 RepID=A0A1I5Y0U0_9GAMM|nr:aminodeoxychorismate synthase component I [Pseudomonas sagittaria]SFQ37720.1 para-aminobenzoate synthetase component 1 [Pseudomonas sagittaria]